MYYEVDCAKSNGDQLIAVKVFMF